jgi:hypothetical protein
VAEAVVKVDEAVVVEIEADNMPTALLKLAVSLEVAVTLDEGDELELALAHQMIPPMMARIIMPAMT